LLNIEKLDGEQWMTQMGSARFDGDTSTTDLLAQHGLPPIDEDDAPFGEVIYVGSELKTDKAKLKWEQHDTH
jgi:hypothetical protein